MASSMYVLPGWMPHPGWMPVQMGYMRRTAQHNICKGSS